MDDTNTMFYFIAWSDAGPGIEQEAWRKFCGAQPGIDLDPHYRKLRIYDNNYLQDRQAMKLGDFTGIRGIPMQDMAMWETMGRIADRSCERLGASDLAIVEFRRIMVDAVRRFAQGGKAIGTDAPRVPKAKLRSFEGIVPRSTDWKTLNVSPEETATRGQAHAAD
jgi:phthalate 4,5-dioxygenase oxygenase subunit